MRKSIVWIVFVNGLFQFPYLGFTTLIFGNKREFCLNHCERGKEDKEEERGSG